MVEGWDSTADDNVQRSKLLRGRLHTPEIYRPGRSEWDKTYEQNIDPISALYQPSVNWVLVCTCAGLEKFAGGHPNTLVVLCDEATRECLTSSRVRATWIFRCFRSDILNDSEARTLVEGPVTRLRHKQLLLSIAWKHPSCTPQRL